MTADRYYCSSCPEDFSALELIETRFEHGCCYLELECKHCHQFWTGEVSIQDKQEDEDAGLFSDQPRPRWRLIRMMPQATAVCGLATSH